MRRHRPIVLTLCLFSAACGASQESPAPDDIVPSDVSDATPTPHVLAPVQAFELTGRDLGRGVLRFGWHEDRAREGSADTILIRDAADPGAALLARYIYTFGATADADADWGWRTEAAEPGLIAADVEFDYEENGLPIDSLAGGWVRVLYGTTEAGDSRKGWARLRTNVEAVHWPELFAERNLFFLDDVTPEFYAAPDGPPVTITLAREPDPPHRLDYTMQPDSLAGSWMRVRLFTPSNYCFDPLDPAEHVVWIRFLDDRSRPRVFYHSRGC